MHLPYELYLKYAIAKKQTHKQVVEFLSLLKIPTPSIDLFNEVKTNFSKKEHVKVKVYLDSSKADPQKQNEPYFKEFLATHALLCYWENPLCFINDMDKIKTLSEYDEVRKCVNSLILTKKISSEDICMRINNNYMVAFTPEDIHDYKCLLWNTEKTNRREWEVIIKNIPDPEERMEYLKGLDGSFEFSTSIKYGSVSKADLEGKKYDIMAMLLERLYLSLKSGASQKDVNDIVITIDKLERKSSVAPKAISRGDDEQEIIDADFEDMSLISQPQAIMPYTDLGANVIDINSRIAEKSEQ